MSTPSPQEVAEHNRRELKPCPFDGGTPKIIRAGTHRWSMIIACEDCGCRMESGDVMGLTAPESYKWNQRHSMAGAE